MRSWFLIFVIVSAEMFFSSAQARDTQQRIKELESIAESTYIFGYPLVLTDLTCRVRTAVVQPTDTKAPINQILHLRSFPTPNFQDIVSPNVDTLYSTACLDLNKEPMVLSVPEMGSRYYLFQLMDAWTNVFSAPGTRTTGSKAHVFVLTGPNWKGSLPFGTYRIASPTNIVFMIGRIYTDGERDFANVNKIQDQIRLYPLSAFGTTYMPPKMAVDGSINVTTPPPEQVAQMSSAEFFKRLNMLMQNNPPKDQDQAEVAKISSITASHIDGPLTSEQVSLALDRGLVAARAKIENAAHNPSGKSTHGWFYRSGQIGNYGTDYLLRAEVALVGWGANLPQDAVYPRCLVDGHGKALNGKNKYVIHFEKSQLPPVHAFWSITVYNEKQYLVANPLNRYSLGDRSNLKYNSDGSLDIYISNTSLGPEFESNWLPVPEGSFNLIMRLYWPRQIVLDSLWEIPAVNKIPFF